MKQESENSSLYIIVQLSVVGVYSNFVFQGESSRG